MPTGTNPSRRFVADGPQVPLRLLRALEEERVVFFCGAGISVGTGLPGFKGLTEEAIKHVGGPDRLKNDCALSDAFNGEQYDKALDVLEHLEGNEENPRPRGVTRRFVMKRLRQRLTKRDKEGLRLHRALLKLARLKPSLGQQEELGYRLVTTNYDDRFELAVSLQERAALRRWIDAAPRLHRPRREGPSYLTYLHGRIETGQHKRNPSKHSLVLTSADFGNAYLRDGYAARFALELFREFTVVFVGYSLSDPVMRYLMDVLATEIGGRASRPQLRCCWRRARLSPKR